MKTADTTAFDRTLARLTAFGATLAAGFFAVAIPLAFYSFGYHFHAGQVAAEAAAQAQLISSHASRSPTLWQYGHEHLENILARRAGDLHELHRVVDMDGNVLAEHGTQAEQLSAPIVRGQAPILDSGHLVGTVTVARSLRGVYLQTIVVAIAAIAFAGAIYVGLRTLPLRALRRAVDNASYIAAHDPLTDLPNRALFSDRLQQALAFAERHDQHVALLCLDLDRFKDVNDTLGHGIGDLLLKEVSRRLTGCLRQTDTLARLGGDEFAIVQVGLAQPDNGAVLARRILEALEQPLTLDSHELLVSTSIGIAVYPGDGRDNATLLQNADTALYRAKADGRNTSRFFEEEMNAALRTRKQIELGLRRAMAQDRFTLHYQPQCDLKTGKLTGVEALLRWTDDELGCQQPDTFIPIAEETGLILPIGDWVLRKACTDALAWPDLDVAVNLSPVQFRHPDLCDRVTKILKEVGFPPERLELEITEGVLLKDTEHTLATLHKLKDMGIRIAMDDFGTGYSSLSYLRRFPFDKIKVDKSFVRDLGQTDEAAAIIRAIVGMGRSLHMRANAEGVETEEQATWLRHEDCDEIQGYLFGRPMPPDKIGQLLQTPPIVADATSVDGPAAAATRPREPVVEPA